MLSIFLFISLSFAQLHYWVKYEDPIDPVEANSLKWMPGYEILHTADRRHLCHVPEILPQVPVEHNETQLREEAIQVIRQTFSTQNCLLGHDVYVNYWTVGFCFGDKIIQYHEDHEHFKKTGLHRPHMPEFVFTLGRFPGSPSRPSHGTVSNLLKGKPYNPAKDDFIVTDTWIKQHGGSQKKVLQQQLRDGTLCDLTGLPREITVSYTCSSTLSVVSVNEYLTCRYEMVIGVPGLCKLEAFGESQTNSSQAIVCREIGWVSMDPPAKVSPAQLVCEPLGGAFFLCKNGKRQVLYSAGLDTSLAYFEAWIRELVIEIKGGGAVPIYDHKGDLLYVVRSVDKELVFEDVETMMRRMKKEEIAKMMEEVGEITHDIKEKEKDQEKDQKDQEKNQKDQEKDQKDQEKDNNNVQDEYVQEKGQEKVQEKGQENQEKEQNKDQNEDVHDKEQNKDVQDKDQHKEHDKDVKDKVVQDKGKHEQHFFTMEPHGL